MDNYKANKLLEIYKKKNKSIFFIIYISISVMIILLWSLYPSVTLLMFLIIASYHFGREDTSFLHQNNYYVDQALYLIKGSLIVFAPLFFHIDETIEIFETLLISDNILFYIKKRPFYIKEKTFLYHKILFFAYKVVICKQILFLSKRFSLFHLIFFYCIMLF